MLSKNEIKFLRQLQQKKYRRENNMFIVEGTKSIIELLKSNYVIKNIYATSEWYEKHKHLIDYSVTLVSHKECERISSLQTSPEVFALVEMKKSKKIILSDKILIIDDIKDTGNFGTIIRTADWFGIKTVICSEQSVELYNPKTIQATMGSFTRVNVHYTDLKVFLQTLSDDYVVYGTFMEGVALHKVAFAPKTAVVIGNESRGISLEVEKFVQKKICISKKNKESVDSLNAAIATAIVCYELTK